MLNLEELLASVSCFAGISQLWQVYCNVFGLKCHLEGILV